MSDIPNLDFDIVPYQTRVAELLKVLDNIDKGPSLYLPMSDTSLDFDIVPYQTRVAELLKVLDNMD